MLAESVEDRIFELVDELDELVKKHGGLENLPDDIREESGKQNEVQEDIQTHIMLFLLTAHISTLSNSTLSIINSRDGKANKKSSDSIRRSGEW